MPLATADLDFLRDLVSRKSGNVISQQQGYLFESRLTSVLQRGGFPNLAALVMELRRNPKPALVDEIAEAMTINETSFFRDVAPFDALRTSVIPRLMQARASTKALTVWCAASSSGQEPYTLAMVFAEAGLLQNGWTVRITASDVSDEMLNRSRRGAYSQFEVNRGLPARMLIKYFDRRGTEWEVRPELKQMIDFRKVNLTDAWPYMPQFDVIFIRNVLIYFDRTKKQEILRKAHRMLKTDGFLFLGGGETLINLDTPYSRESVGNTVCYRPTQS
ncbi:MAG: protein-glutamate O-methyltransferase CheR [Planctomycetales bacterium]|nr:protein-glutamate O-methyltransferase CheR [Planctomycetales bacterium]